MNSLTSFLCISLMMLSVYSFAQRGKDGNVTINTVNRIVNEYTTLTANAASGNSSITVAVSGLNTNGRFSASLAAGDLIMIIQMQGATILGQPDAFTPAISNPNDATWGSVTNYNNCGKYEYAEVSSVPNGTTINLDCGLQNDYTSAGRVQVIRVPRYNTLTLTSPGVLTCQAWNGTTGGVLAVEVLGTTTMNAGSKINTSATGFRGGATFTTTGRTSTTLYSCASLDVGTNKGEGIAGYDTDYTPYGGKYCRAAAANAGGGGNVWNCGGGGGGNAGNTGAWTGQGNPNTSGAGWATAWNLESPGFATSTSSGGGRGGYSFSSSNQNATTLGPGTPGVTNAWSGSYRYNLGGLGGRPLDYSTGRIFLGGGGGAGEQDNGQAGAGGKGGGIIYFVTYGAFTGSGNDSIISDGAVGGSTNISGSNPGKDAGGGAGAGGTIILNSTGVISGVAIRANGGIGGYQLQNTSGFFNLTEAEGPGGGGGGGYIAVANGTPAQQANGGNNGQTQSSQLSEFTPNGATMGGAGLTGQTITNFTITAANVTICSGNTATLTASITGTAPAGTTIMWYSAQTGGTSIGSGTSFTTPVLTNTTTYYVGTCPGTYRIPVIVTVNPGLTVSVNSPTICAGSTTTLTATGATSYTWSAGATSTGVNTATVSPASTTTFTVTGTTGGCSGTAVSTVTVGSAPVATFSYTGSPYCKNAANPSPTFSGGGTAGTFTSTAGLSINSGTGAVDLALSTAGTYTVTNTIAASGGCPQVSATATITITPLPVATFSYTASPYCKNAANPSPTFSGGGTAGIFSSTVGLTINSSSGLVDLAASTAGTYTVTNTIAASGGCPQVTATATITITPVPIATFNYAGSPYCKNAANPSPTFTGGGTAGTFTSTAGLSINASTGAVNLSASTAGTYTVTNTIAASGGCPQVTATATITITPLPVATFSYTASPYCKNAANPSPTFSGSGTAGTFTSTAGLSINAGTGVVDLALSTAGTYTVTNTIAASGGCPQVTATATITITPVPVATFNYAGTPYCQNASNPSPAFTGGGTAGTFTSTPGLSINASTGAVNLAASTAGTYTVTNTIAASGGCPQTTATSTITITAVPVATFSYTASPYCQNAANPSPTFTGGGIAGTFTSTSGLSISAATGVVDLALSTAGTYTVTNTIAATGGCASTSSTASITISSPKTGAFNYAGSPYCQNALDPSPVFTGGGVAGTFSSTAGLSIDPATGLVDLSASTAGTYTVTNTIAASGGCPVVTATNTITINPVQNPGFNYSSSVFCQSGTNPTPTVTGTIGGVFSSSPSGLNIDPSTGTINLAGSTLNTYSVTYTTSGPCADDSTISITITNSPVATFGYAASSYCANGTDPSPVFSGGGAAGVFSSTAGLSINASNGTVDLSASSPGTYTVTNSIAASGGCSAATATSTITINPVAVASFTYSSVSYCQSAADPSPVLSPGGSNGVYSSAAGLSINSASGVVDLSVSLPGTYTVINSVGGGCPSVDSTVITITTPPDATITQPTSICAGASPFNLSAATAGGSWSGTGITDPLNGTFDPASGVGSDTITYALSGSCPVQDTVVVNVTSLLDATITATNPVCEGSAAFNLSAATSGGTWSGTGITNSSAGTFDPAVAGTYTVTYTISGSCGNSDTEVITVNSPVSISFTPVAAVCDGTSAFNLSATPSGGGWSGTGITDPVAGTFDPSVSGPGTFSVIYTIAGACGNASSENITVNPLPVPSVSSNLNSGCAPLCVTFTETTSATCSSLSYDFGDGNTGTSVGPVHCYSNSGTYTVAISCTDANGCTGTTASAAVINVSPVPDAAMTISPTGILPVNTTVTFTDASTSGGNQFWNFGDTTSVNNTSFLSSDSHTYSAEGTYCIMLVSSNTNGCIDSTSECITVVNDAVVTVPNIFTPNGDGNNDVFKISSSGLKSLKCSIYDRWGLKVADLESVNSAWDGRTTTGSIVPDGVYFYILDFTALNDKSTEKQGFVQLLSK